MLLATGLLIAVMVSAGYLRSLEGIQDVEHGRAMALATLTTASACVTAALSRFRTRAAWMTFLGTLASSVLLIQTPKVGALLHLSPLHWDDWMLALVGGVVAATLPFASQLIKGYPPSDT